MSVLSKCTESFLFCGCVRVCACTCGSRGVGVGGLVNVACLSQPISILISEMGFLTEAGGLPLSEADCTVSYRAELVSPALGFQVQTVMCLAYII